MAFKVPSLSEVNMTVENGFSRAFYGTSGTLRAMVLKVVSKVVAGAVYIVCLLLAYIWKNSFVDSADIDGLVNIGTKHDVTPKPASRSRGVVAVAAAAGTSIPAGTAFIDPQTQKEYETIASASVAVGNTSVKVQVYALEYGSASNIPEGTALEFRDAEISGVLSITVAEGGLYGGVSIDVTVDGVVRQWGEGVEDYRNRVRIREQNQPEGGSKVDYWEWAMRFPQVSSCWVIPNWPATNRVAVFLADFNSDDIILNSVELQEISDYINSDDRRPATSEPLVASVTPVDMSCHIFIPTVNDYTKNSVMNALRAYFKTLGPGDIFSATTIRQYLIANADVANCEVSSVYVDGVSYGKNDVTLSKDYEYESSVYSISGNVININAIDVLFARL